MNTIKISVEYQECTYNELNNTDCELTNAAREATYKSYAPYSNFHVGAAILLTNGLIIQGSNQENAAFGAGTCAERTALFYAQSEYPNEKIKAIAIAARGSDGDFTVCPISPCGICRQALIEAQTRTQQAFRILMCGKDKVRIVDDASTLLPIQFDTIV